MFVPIIVCDRKVECTVTSAKVAAFISILYKIVTIVSAFCDKSMSRYEIRLKIIASHLLGDFLIMVCIRPKDVL